jgi:2-polyprenyl-3-methyl-5-hydroxy-6-metoxy-1,4-benzoquinol methylase
MDWFIEKFKKLGVKSILDVGCGIGRHASLFKDHNYLGIDIVRGYVDKAVKISDQPHIVLDATELEKHIVPNSFDAVFWFDSLEHLDKNVGLKALHYSVFVAKKCVAVYTPDGFLEQTEDVWGENAHDAQTHKSGWITDDFYKIGFDEYHKEVLRRRTGRVTIIRALLTKDQLKTKISDEDKATINKFIDNTSCDPSYQRVEVKGDVIRDGRVGSLITWENTRNSGISLYNKSVCDIGCFNGYFSFKAEEAGAREVTGFDADAPAIETCNKLKELRESNCQFVGRRFGNDWFFDKKYDVIMSFNMLHHVRKQVGDEKYGKAIKDLFAHCSEALFEIDPKDNEIITDIANKCGFIPARTIKGHRHGRVVVYFAPWLTTKQIHIKDVNNYKGKNINWVMSVHPPLTVEACFEKLHELMDNGDWRPGKLYNRIVNNIKIIEHSMSNPKNQPVHDLCLDTYEALISMNEYHHRDRIVRGGTTQLVVRDYLRIIDCFNGVKSGIKLPPVGMRSGNRLFQGHFRTRVYIASGMTDIKLDYFDEEDYERIDSRTYFVV